MPGLGGHTGNHQGRSGGGEMAGWGHQPLSWSLWDKTGGAGEAPWGLGSWNNPSALGHGDCPWLSSTSPG